MTQPARSGTGGTRGGGAGDGRGGGAGRRFLINLIGVIGLVFGVLAMVSYLLEIHVLDFTTAPYAWLRLAGAARLLPPAMVLVACLVSSFLLERSAERG